MTLTYDTPRATVRRIDAGRVGYVTTAGTRHGVNRAWRIYLDGVPTFATVVDARWGYTIVGVDERMVTSFHAGLSAGDLARHHVKYRGTGDLLWSPVHAAAQETFSTRT